MRTLYRLTANICIVCGFVLAQQSMSIGLLVRQQEMYFKANFGRQYLFSCLPACLPACLLANLEINSSAVSKTWST